MDDKSKAGLLIWDSMLSADLNRRYFAAVASRLQLQDRTGKILVAVASSTTVAAWVLWSQPGWNWTWQTFSVAAAIVAVALPILNLAAGMKTAGTLSGSWFAIMRDYELLWARGDGLSNEDALDACKAILSAEGPLAEQETTLSMHRSLLRRCEDEVRRSRGLPTD
jgi:hypothetical protein